MWRRRIACGIANRTSLSCTSAPHGQLIVVAHTSPFLKHKLRWKLLRRTGCCSKKMAPRFEKFMDKAGKVLTNANVAPVVEKMEEDFSSIDSIMEEEKTSSSSYAEAWARAEELYESTLKQALPPKDAKVINTEIPEKLPPSLKSKPSFVPVAVIVCTQEEQEFVKEFNEATQKMLESGDWSSFKFRSLFMLLSLAQRHLFSRPSRDINRVIFRSVAIDWDVKRDQIINFGYYASFTVRRPVAMGIQGKDEDEVGESEGPTAALRPTLVKMEFAPSVSGVGVKHLSPLGEEEREVIVSPLQNFKVVEVNHKKKKSLKIYTLQPVEE